MSHPRGDCATHVFCGLARRGSAISAGPLSGARITLRQSSPAQYAAQSPAHDGPADRVAHRSGDRLAKTAGDLARHLVGDRAGDLAGDELAGGQPRATWTAGAENRSKDRTDLAEDPALLRRTVG